jgi:photosystem II stability/assembly factor-like uncharacterized protein
MITVNCSKEDEYQPPAPTKPYVWIAGDMDSTGYGMILFSADSGETWVRQGLGTSALRNINVNDIWAVDENNVWAVGDSSSVLRTSDGGKNWFRLNFQGSLPKSQLNSISIINQTTIWICGSEGIVMNSMNSGYHWILYDTTFFKNALLQGVCAVTPGKIYVVGNRSDSTQVRGFIGYTVDGGKNWDTLGLKDNYNAHEWIGAATAGSSIVIYGEKAHYTVSKDEGLTWTNAMIPGTGGVLGADINHLVLVDANTWWGALDLDQIYETTNTGATWSSQPSNQNGEFNLGIDAFNNTLAIVVGTFPGWPEKGTIQKTNDGGNTWRNIKTYRSFLNKVTFSKP